MENGWIAELSTRENKESTVVEFHIKSIFFFKEGFLLNSNFFFFLGGGSLMVTYQFLLITF